MAQKTLHIGIDDTDSTTRGCTTYVAALLVEKLLKFHASFIDYPNLIRLNPNVPWKTRGNGALCLRIVYDESVEAQIKETVISSVEQQSDLEHRGTDPGIVFLGRTKPPIEVQTFARNATTGVVTLKDAISLVKKFRGEAFGFKNGRGIIGALAAIGETLRSDHTYEIIFYREPENWGTKRRVDQQSIFEMDAATRPYTFNNVDTEKKRVIITPRGPDPILFGIRGESAETVKRACGIVKVLEPAERWVIFRTNQGTDSHLRNVKKLKEIEPYSPAAATGTISAAPRMIRGRHLIFRIKDETSEVDCAAYEPTGYLRTIVKKLIPGDRVKVFGGVRPPSHDTPMTVNLEKLKLLKLAPLFVYHNPICTKCGRRLKSMGTKKGFRCDKCGSRYTLRTKVKVKLEREVRKGLYITSARSQRHLTKPAVRYGMEKRSGQIDPMIEQWHFP
jgi:tRNA(Ile2)-agmatinylcytidine synthase